MSPDAWMMRLFHHHGMPVQHAQTTYTLWSRGRLLGETDLGFVYRLNGFRCGWFFPTPIGERLMPMATGVAPALRVLCALGEDPTLRADFRAAMDQEVALELQLRGPDGEVVATHDIGVRDTHYLREVAAAELARFEAEEATGNKALLELEDSFDEPLPFDPEMPADDDLDDDDPPEHPRYQIQILLVDPEAIP